MKQLLTLIGAFLLIAHPLALSSQKSYKAVCDKTDGTVKIVDSEDRSPSLVPLKGGFPFYQVAEKWVNKNYPGGKCDPAAAVKQNQAAADAVTQAAPGQNNAPAAQVKPSNTQNASPNVPANQTYRSAPVARYRNTSMYISFLFTNLGKVYNLDPPLIPGISMGIEHVVGTRFCGGTGVHLNALIGKTEDVAGVNSFYNISIPLFAEYRQLTGRRMMGVDLGLAVNTTLRPVTGDSDLAGEVASNYSINALTRLRFGNERSAFELGADIWLSDILASEEGFQMTSIYVGYRFYF
jgi:hypothetical protein